MSELENLKVIVQSYETSPKIWGRMTVKHGFLVVRQSADAYYIVEMQNGLVVLEPTTYTADQLKNLHMQHEPEEYPMAETLYGE